MFVAADLNYITQNTVYSVLLYSDTSDHCFIIISLNIQYYSIVLILLQPLHLRLEINPRI